MSDRVQELRHEILYVDEDGKLVYGDAIAVSRRTERDEIYAQWMEVPDGFLDRPQMRELAVRMLTVELDRALA